MQTPRSRFTVITIALLVASVSLTACGSTTEQEASPTPPATVSTPVETASHGHALGDGTIAAVSTYALEVIAVPDAKTSGQLSFSITDNGAPLTEYAERHTKKLHLIAVSKDLSNFLHIHPELTDGGIWNVAVNFPEGGSWRIYTDFATAANADGVILGALIDVKGASTATPLGSPAAMFSAEGFDFAVSGTIPADDHGMLMITVMKDGKFVNFEDYLGASGHLVAIREADGAYAHFHPQGHVHGTTVTPPTSDGATVTVDPMNQGEGMSAGSTGGMSMSMPGMLHFDTEVPGAGRYRMFLEFMTGGKLYQVAFTADVA
jgi:hypothetical protein